MLARTCTILALHESHSAEWCCNGRMYLDELRTLLARHARPDMTTAIDGVLISKVDRPDPPSPSMSGTVLALIAQGAKRLALGDRVYEYRARAVPGRLGRPAGHRPLHRGRPRAAGAGLRSDPGTVRRRRAAAAGRPRRHPPRRRRRAVGHRRQRRAGRAARRGGPAAAPARRAPRPRRAGAAGQARDPVAADHRRAGCDGSPARPGRQQPQPRRPGGALDPRALRASPSGSRTWRSCPA